MEPMTKRERIFATAQREPVDRVATLGGWITSAAHYQELVGISEDEFWDDPQGAAIEAYKILDVDGLVMVFIPPSQERYRNMDIQTVETRHATYKTPESARDYIHETCHGLDTIEREWDGDAWRQKYVEERKRMQAKVGDMVWMPPFWDASGIFMWYSLFGYESYLGAVGEYPDDIRTLWEHSARRSYLCNIEIARAIRENDFAPALLLGQDICSTAGPLVSPAFLDETYFKFAKEALRPLHEAGIKTFWHSDGNILPILDSIIDLGVSGFQGFQEEIGIHIADMVKRRSATGEAFLFYGSVSVSGTLPHGTVDDVRGAVANSIEATDGRGLFIFPSNTIGPEVPLKNIRAMYAYPREYVARV
jgi:hypothetical protein